ncbi:hypothetical protein EAE99_002664 [Botrytis elliptica]|nr:hypothetical protein EAE99_002664 [Botrytis elliptica]
MNASSVCVADADALFGPRVDPCQCFHRRAIRNIYHMLSLRIPKLYREKRKTLPNSLWGFKLVVISVILRLQIALLASWIVSQGQQTPVSVPATVLSVIATIGLAASSNLENNRSIRPSLVICTYLLLSTLLDIAQARTLWLQHGNAALSALFTSSVLAKAVLLCLEAFEKRSFLKDPYNRYPPESLAGVINTSLFWWLNTLIQNGHRNLLSLGDLFDTDKALSSSSLGTKMQTAWRNQSPNGKYSLLFAILTIFKIPLLTLIFPPISLIENPETPGNQNIGYALIDATALIYLGLAISTAQYQHQIFRVITMIRGGLVCIIYNVTLSLDANSTGDSAAVTLMSTDI